MGAPKYFLIRPNRKGFIVYFYKSTEDENGQSLQPRKIQVTLDEKGYCLVQEQQYYVDLRAVLMSLATDGNEIMELKKQELMKEKYDWNFNKAITEQLAAFIEEKQSKVKKHILTSFPKNLSEEELMKSPKLTGNEPLANPHTFTVTSCSWLRRGNYHTTKREFKFVVNCKKEGMQWIDVIKDRIHNTVEEELANARGSEDAHVTFSNAEKEKYRKIFMTNINNAKKNPVIMKERLSVLKRIGTGWKSRVVKLTKFSLEIYKPREHHPTHAAALSIGNVDV